MILIKQATKVPGQNIFSRRFFNNYQIVSFQKNLEKKLMSHGHKRRNNNSGTN